MSNNEVWMLEVQTAGEEGMTSEGQAYSRYFVSGIALDTATGEARHLTDEDVSDDEEALVGRVADDMDVLCMRAVEVYAKWLAEETVEGKEVSRGELWIRLMNDFGNKPVQLIANMLASMIAGCASTVATDQDPETALADLRQAIDSRNTQG